MDKANPTPRMTIRELRTFLAKGKDDYRIRSTLNRDGLLCLRIYRRSMLDSIKEKLFDKYRIKAQHDREAAYRGIEAVLGRRVGELRPTRHSVISGRNSRPRPGTSGFAI